MILAGIVLAEAAAIFDGKQATQTQSYGPEARGGASRSEVVISDGEIDHPEVLSADVVVALSREAYKKFAKTVRAGGLVSRESIEKAIAARAPKGTEEMNRKALQAGFAAAERVRDAA
jgi:2-oxoglutarate ferredoxin oxidoreductase subunit gamma